MIHEALCKPANPNREPTAVQLLSDLRQAGVKLLCGPRAEDRLSLYFPFDGRVESFRTEYGEKTLSVEIVEDLQSAIDHIHRNGSSHTEVDTNDFFSYLKQNNRFIFRLSLLKIWKLVKRSFGWWMQLAFFGTPVLDLLMVTALVLVQR